MHGYGNNTKIFPIRMWAILLSYYVVEKNAVALDVCVKVKQKENSGCKWLTVGF